MWQAELAIRPPGEDEIVHEVSPLLNCPVRIDTCTFSPGFAVAGVVGHAVGVQVNVRVGVGSTLNVAGIALKSPLLPVTTIP
jgi:hypothetical protein